MQDCGIFHRGLHTACSACKQRKIRCDKQPDSDRCTRCRKKDLPCLTIEPRSTQAEVERPAKRARKQTARDDTGLDVDDVHGQVDTAPAARGNVKNDDLALFFERGIHSLDWAVFSGKEPVRLVYTGSQIASLHHLVRSEDNGHTLHYPFPQIKPPARWQPDLTQGLRATYLTAAASIDLSTLPPRAVRDSLIDTYFEDINPGFPVVNEMEFRQQYLSVNDQPPLLLLQCVLLAAARISTHPAIASARSSFTGAAYRRAKALFEIRHENDRIQLVQASLLFAWHVEDSDTVSNGPYFWIGQAARIAFGLGIHRNLSPSSPSLMPPSERRLYRRVWWALLRSEAHVGLEYGRPTMIRMEDSDQVPLMDSDFEDEENPASQHLYGRHCRLDAEIAGLALRVISTTAVNGLRDLDESVNVQLVKLTQELPLTHDFWSTQLRINHSVVTLFIHRTQPSAESLLIAQDAASAILAAFKSMVARGTIRRCTYFASTALLGAAVQFAQTVKREASTTSRMKALNSHAQLDRLNGPIEALATYWPHVQAVQKLVSKLHARCAGLLGRESPEEVSPDAAFDLDHILNEYVVADFWRDMSSVDWTGAFDTT